MLFSIILLLITLLFFIPLTISFTYFLLGVVSIAIGIKEKNKLKIRSGAKTILYSLIAFITILLVVPWIAAFIGEDLFDFLG